VTFGKIDEDGDCAAWGRVCSRDNRLGGGGGSTGSSFKMLMMFDRFAGVGRACSVEGAAGVEFGRLGSCWLPKTDCGRMETGE
jgi:hypothetical protein